MERNSVSDRQKISPEFGAEWRPKLALADLEVVDNAPIGDAYWEVVLTAPPLHTSAAPGQFFHIECPASDAGAPFLRRPMSVYGTDPDRGQIAFLYKVTGIGTHGLSTLRPGDRLSVCGPLGVGFGIDCGHKHALIVARGVGIATMAPLAPALARARVMVTTIFSARNPAAVVGLGAFQDHGTVHTVLDSDGTSDIGSVRARIEEIHRFQPIDIAYTCGSKRLARLLHDLIDIHGFAGEVALEQQMACALGMCHACVIDRLVDGRIESARVCTIGPVFDLRDIP